MPASTHVSSKESRVTPQLFQPIEESLELFGYDFAYRFYNVRNSLGPPTLFISGAFQNFQSWKRLAEYFVSQGKSVLLLNLPGTGECKPLPPSYGIEFLSLAIKFALDHLNISKVSIGAASYSTPTAYLFANQYPEYLNNLTLCGTMHDVPGHLRPYVWLSIEKLREGKMDDFANSILGFTGPLQGCGMMCTDPERKISRRKFVYRLLYSQLTNMSDSNRQRYENNTLRLLTSPGIDLSKPPKCKTLVFTGEHDTFTRPEYCKKIAESIPNSIYTTIDDSDHFCHLEQFETISELSHNFMYDLPIAHIKGIAKPRKPASCLPRALTHRSMSVATLNPLLVHRMSA